MLKQVQAVAVAVKIRQPPSGGCVLKLAVSRAEVWVVAQPPSGGCVLKQAQLKLDFQCGGPAAFGRLCVETSRLRLFQP